MRIAELRVRGRQGASMAAERLGLSKLAQIPSDSSFLRLLDPVLRIDSTEDLFEHFRNRKFPFYESFDRREAVVGILKDRFPDHVNSIIERAKRICAGTFDLLGYRNISFRGVIPDWHYDPVSNKTSPRLHWSQIGELEPAETGDKKVIWELNRHQYFLTLGQAYWLTNDESYAESFLGHLENWIENNPPKVGVNWLSSLEIAFRSISWIASFHFFKDSPRLNVEIFTRMVKYLYLFGRHLETYLSTYFSPNTHLTGEALGLYILGNFLSDSEPGKRWKSLGQKILIDALEFQVRSDGVYCEQSSHYQRYTTDFYLNFLILRRLDGDKIEPHLETKVNRLLDFLIHITQPDGRTPLFGDDDGGRLFFLDSAELTDFRPTLALGAVVTGRADLKFMAGDAVPELLFLAGPDGLLKFDRIVPIEPSATIKGFEDGGFYVARSSWRNDADFLLMDCGPHGFLNGGHAHADALNVLVSVAGRALFTDSGTFSYASDPTARDRFRSTAAHNCLTVNGKSSSEPGGPFSWRSTAVCQLIEWDEDGERAYFRGKHNGFCEMGVEYFREVKFSRDRTLSIVDDIISSRENSFEVNFILSPELKAVAQGRSLTFFEGDRSFAMMETSISNGAQTEWLIEEWTVSSCYAAFTPTKRLRLVVRGVGEISITNVIRHL